MFGWRSWPWSFLFLAITVTREWISRSRNGPAEPRRAQAERPSYREKCGEAAMNQPYGNTPVKIAAFMEFQRGRKKLATTTGGEPVHSACGSGSGRIHGNDVSIALNRMQGICGFFSAQADALDRHNYRHN